MRPTHLGTAICLAAALACANGGGDDSASGATKSDGATGQGSPARGAGGAQGTASVPATGGVPAGYIGRLDNPAKSISGVTYAPGSDGTWEVNSGSHALNMSHIVYTPGDTASGTYTVRAEMDQVRTEVHPEAFGVFIGGQDLTGPGEKYGYFLVRSDGTYSIKLREGKTARVLVDFSPSPSVPQSDASGRARYPIAVQVAADSVRFLVGTHPVAAIARSRVPTNGIVGLRVNHGLRLTITPLTISR